MICVVRERMMTASPGETILVQLHPSLLHHRLN
jgi:hypothetical protein